VSAKVEICALGNCDCLKQVYVLGMFGSYDYNIWVALSAQIVKINSMYYYYYPLLLIIISY
jgi:hypothetical protein